MSTQKRKNAWLTRMEAVSAELEAIRVEVSQHHPSAFWYLDSTGDLNLMIGDVTYNDRGGRPPTHPENILLSVTIRRASGGDW